MEFNFILWNLVLRQKKKKKEGDNDDDDNDQFVEVEQLEEKTIPLMTKIYRKTN